MENLLMPRLGLTMESGVITKWYIKVGDSFLRNEPLFDVESDKLVNTVEARFDGRLVQILVAEGEECNVSETIAVVEKL